MENRADEVWATASRAHLTLDFRFNSQPLAAAFTERASIGGRGWSNVIFDDKRYDCVLALWGNCTLGLLSFWWHSSRQQPGRGIIAIRAAESLPALDFRVLTDEQLATTQAIFEEFREKELQPAYLADVDENRALLDRRVVCDLLRFDDGVYRAVRLLAAKWCAEPSVHGGKRHLGTTAVATISGTGRIVPREQEPEQQPLSLTADERAWLDEYKRQLHERFPGLIESIVVYGINSNRAAYAEVDLNTLVIIKEGDRKTEDAVSQLGHIIDMTGFFVAPSILVYTASDWEERKRSDSPIYQMVAKDGFQEV